MRFLSGGRRKAPHPAGLLSAGTEPRASHNLFLSCPCCEPLLRLLPLAGLQWGAPLPTGCARSEGRCEEAGGQRGPWLAAELQDTLCTCFVAAPGAVLHQLDEEAGQVVGVQHPCQRAQGQAGDRREGVKWRAQTTARTDTNAPRGNWERQQKNNDGQSSSCSHKYHRAGRSAAVFASWGTAPLPPPTQPAAEGGPGLQPAGTSKRAAQGTSRAAPGHPPVHLVSDVPQH